MQVNVERIVSAEPVGANCNRCLELRPEQSIRDRISQRDEPRQKQRPQAKIDW